MSLLPLPAPAPATPLPASAAAPARWYSASPGRLARHVLTVLPLVLIGVWMAADWRGLYDGVSRLTAADPWWLLAGAGFACLTWVAAAVVRQGAIPERLPPLLLVASQFAAGAANHVLPASIGAHAVTLRFLQGQGIPLPRAAASLALYSLVKPIAKTFVLLALLLAAPELIRGEGLVPDGGTLLMAAVGVATVLATSALLLATVRPLRRGCLGFLHTALTDARLLHTMPSRVLALWGGAAVTPLLQAGVVASVGASLGLPLSWAQMVFAFLAASTAVGAVPAPGGIGPVDAALVFTMVTFGAALAPATATVIGYRVLTVWLPLVPGMLVLSALVHRKVL
ncbi:lysylphosphatidylglycerol synthase transmembrane domain-containing protein [Streptomyces sp. P17]|uniref:lysylphosphatidylglycerol synthase transmembrane domain-containing protein n=1 Tax=Streptomyces sp. P17 TaxID=3074716 RepID=UPI0028F43EF9|nr:lysylphosphatidylglycerol synthase transmembrane domain-containing protein [Streptomyces sp. P17]MDT9695083.1 lysylphosphatidylglycerol synthase transmembrane domain-containing protein [Streptomyces sp. P17]